MGFYVWQRVRPMNDNVYDPGSLQGDGLPIVHTFVLRVCDLWNLDTWLGPALGIVIDEFLERAPWRDKDTDEWAEKLRKISTDLKLAGSSDYYSDGALSLVERAYQDFAKVIQDLWY